MRGSYLAAAFFLISLDYALANLSFASTEEKRVAIVEGLRYGHEGRTRTDQVISIATELAKKYSKSGISSAKLRSDIESGAKSIPFEIVAEYFSKPQIVSSLFQTACDLHNKALSIVPAAPSSLSTECRIAISVLLDLFGVERPRYFGTATPEFTATASKIEPSQPSLL